MNMDETILLALFVAAILLSVAAMLGIEIRATHGAPGRTIDFENGPKGTPSVAARTVKRRPGSSDLRGRREADARLDVVS